MNTKVTRVFALVSLAVAGLRTTAEVSPRLLLQVGSAQPTSIVGYIRGGREMVTCRDGDGVRIWRIADRALVDYRPIAGATFIIGTLSPDGRKLLLHVGHMR